MINIRLLSRALVSLPALIGPAAAEVPEEWLETPTALLFGAPPTIGNPFLSPDGLSLLFLSQDAVGVSMLRSIDFVDGSVATLLGGSDDGYDVRLCNFASETRLICDLTHGTPDQSIDYQGFYTLNVDGSDQQELPLGSDCPRRNRLQNTLPMDRLPEDPEHIMIICGSTASRINLNSGQVAEVGTAGEVGDRQSLLSNGHGLPNIYSGTSDDSVRWHVRASIEAPWQEFHRMDRATFEAPFRPLGYGSNLNQVFNIGWDADTGTWSIFRQDLTGEYENELIFAQGTVDIELVDTMGQFDRVVSVPYLEDRSWRTILDRRVAEAYQFVSALLPSLEIEILDESWNQNVYLARARPPATTGDFLLVDMANESVQVIAPEYDHLSGYELAATELVQFEGSDGRQVTAYLTRPFNVTGPAPAVIIPRSQASHEDAADPHYLVQFLAASGYAVMRVQNRADAEFGGGWVPERAAVGWRQTAADISHAATYLIANGISERETLCSLGKDYGAHSALISAVEDPDLLSCVISIAGVTDPRLTPAAEIITNGRESSENVLDIASPLNRAAEMQLPVLMFHGDSDAEFNMADHSVALANALERAGKDVEFIEYPNASHDISRAPYRIDMLVRIGNFLNTQIGSALAVGSAQCRDDVPDSNCF